MGIRHRAIGLAIALTTAPGIGLATSPGTGAPGTGQGQAFGQAWLERRAEELSHEPYDPHDGTLPQELVDLTYDQLRDIRFRPEAAIWKGTGSLFELQLFHLGHFYRQPVGIYLVEKGRARQVDYDPSLFDYGANRFPTPLPRDLGFAGFRVHYPLNRPDYPDELVAFLGASYFRALGRSEVYGLSARGLAIDTGVASGEEFPWFREFYVERPARGVTEAGGVRPARQPHHLRRLPLRHHPW